MESHGGDPQGTDFADGLTDGLITRLSQMNPSQLGVIAKTTALQYRNAHKTVSEIGRELKVDYVLEGTVRREGKRVRVAVRLVRAYDQTPLWAETKEWERADEVDVEGDLSSHVAAGLAEKVFAASPGGAADAHPVRAADSGEQGRTPAVRNAP
jgi:TolB-like protein